MCPHGDESTHVPLADQLMSAALDESACQGAGFPAVWFSGVVQPTAGADCTNAYTALGPWAEVGPFNLEVGACALTQMQSNNGELCGQNLVTRLQPGMTHV